MPDETDLFIEELIHNFDSLIDFKKTYNLNGTERCFYYNFYKNEVTLFMHLPFNRKAFLEFSLEYRDGISQSTEIDNLSYNSNMRIKVFRMTSDYRNAKTAAYRNELKLLKEKYDIKDL